MWGSWRLATKTGPATGYLLQTFHATEGFIHIWCRPFLATRLYDFVLKSVEVKISALFTGPIIVADLGGGAPGAAPLRPKIFSNSCSFSQNLAKSYVGAPRRVGAPSYGESWIRPWITGCISKAKFFKAQAF